MSSAKSSTALWSSRAAFYLATIGAAVGLGSIWRLPYQVGSSGGSAFVFVFTIACVLIAMPLLTAELLIGRHSRANPPEAAGVVALESGLTKRWNVIGVLGTVAVFLVLASYTVVGGWVLAYAWKCATGVLVGKTRPEIADLWRSFLASPLEIVLWHAAFLSMVGVVSGCGLRRGIEAAGKLRAVILLILLVVLATYALTSGDARSALIFAFRPNIAAISPKVVLAAVGQAFYATGVGEAMMLAYGSYVPKDTSLVRAAVYITASILLVSLLATLTIFPLVFHYHMNPAEGPELVFDVLATVFAEMPAGRLVGTMFFVLLVFAALTPSIAGFEPVVEWLQQHWSFPRSRAVALAVSGSLLLGIGPALSFNLWSRLHPLGWLPAFRHQTIFDVLDYIPSNVLLPAGALATSIFVGWRLSNRIVDAELSETTPFARRWCVWALKYACPIAICAMFVATLL